MATIKVAPSGAIEAVYIDGVDITMHIVAVPLPTVVKTAEDETGIYALDLRLILERPPMAPRPLSVRATDRPRLLCEPSIESEDGITEPNATTLDQLLADVRETRDAVRKLVAREKRREKAVLRGMKRGAEKGAR